LFSPPSRLNRYLALILPPFSPLLITEVYDLLFLFRPNIAWLGLLSSFFSSTHRAASLIPSSFSLSSLFSPHDAQLRFFVFSLLVLFFCGAGFYPPSYLSACRIARPLPTPFFVFSSFFFPSVHSIFCVDNRPS